MPKVKTDYIFTPIGHAAMTFNIINQVVTSYNEYNMESSFRIHECRTDMWNYTSCFILQYLYNIEIISQIWK